jgi:membrane protein implicated in regulation of membrane protease activity
MKGRKYAVYSLVTTLLEEAAVAAVVLWILPQFDIHLPIWILIAIMLAYASCSYITYRLGRKALDKKAHASPEAGNRGKVVTPLMPKGYIRVGGELWQASSTTSYKIDPGEEVVILSKQGLTLLVEPVKQHNTQDYRQS